MLVVASVVLFIFVGAFSQSSIAQESEYETDRCPGELRLRYVARRSRLTVHTRPDAQSPPRVVRVRPGWLLPHDRCLYKTVRGVDLRAAIDATVRCADADISLRRGEPIRYLQYIGERWALVRLRGTICELDMNPDVIDGTDREPTTEMWIRHTYRDGSAAGWFQFAYDDEEFIVERDPKGGG
jgi:hypothetical protein